MPWIRPWKMTEGFLVGGGLLFVGLLLQVTIGPIAWSQFAAPANVIMLVLMVATIGAMYALRRKVYPFEWMMHYGAAVPCLAYAVALTIIMGLTPQVREGGIPWLGRMLSFWPFVLVWTWMMLIVGLATLDHALRFRLKEIPFILNHLGLFIAVVAATLGSADTSRLKMTVRIGTPEWRAKDDSGELCDMDLAIDLHGFTIEEYPPKLMLMETEGRKVLPEHSIILEGAVEGGGLDGWKIRILEKIDQAAAVTSGEGIRYERLNSPGAVFAIKLEATKGDSTRVGWLSCGSFAFPQQTLELPDGRSLVMPEPEPRRYASDISVYTRDGRSIRGVVEVNKPLKVDGWRIYQFSYDERLGKWSDVSVFELAKDPWLPLVYAGILMMLAGALCLMLFMAPKPVKQ